MNKLFHIIAPIIIVSFSCFGQNKNILTEAWYPGAELEWGVTSEIQLNANDYYLVNSRLAHGWVGGLGWNFNADKKGAFAMAGYDLVGISNVFFFGVVSGNVKYFPWLGHQVVLAPEIGFGIYIFQFGYQPNISLIEQSTINLPVHQFKLTLNFNAVTAIGPFMRTMKDAIDKR